MKTNIFKRTFVAILTCALVFSLFSCIPFSASAAESEIDWKLSFVKNVDGKYEAVESVEPGEEFYLAVGVQNYDSIGELNVVRDDSGKVDKLATSFDNTIGAAIALVNVSNLVTFDQEDIVTPYTSAKIDTNIVDGVLRATVLFDSGSLTKYVGKTALAANDGVFFMVKAIAGDTVGVADFSMNKGTAESGSSSVAVVTKAAGVALTSDSTKNMSMGGYDTVYSLNIAKKTPAGPTYVEGLTIAGKNATFASDYSIMFAVTSANYKAYDKVYIKVKKAVYNGNVANGYAESVLDKAAVSGNFYAYTYEGFAATEIASSVFATVYAEDADGNVYYGPETEYSLRSYAENQIKKANGNAKFKTMMVEFLNYGASAQTYFGYNTSDLANKNIDAYQNLATADRAYSNDRTGTDDTGYAVRFTAFNLVFKNKITILAASNMTADQYAAYKDSGYAVVSYKDADGKDANHRIALNDETQFAYTAGKYCVSFNGLKSKEMSTVVTIALYDGNDTQISNSVTYSIETYAASKVTGTNAKLVQLVKNMMSLGDSCAAYFAK